jgi:hypothetical protein
VPVFNTSNQKALGRLNLRVKISWQPFSCLSSTELGCAFKEGAVGKTTL